MSTSVLVTSGEQSQSLAIVRSLSRDGYDVSVLGNARLSRSLYSRHCSKRYYIKSSRDEPDKYINEIKSIVREGNYDVLLPVGSFDTIHCSKHKDEFGSVAVPVDEYGNIQITYDKEKTFDHAERVGVPGPKTVCPADRGDLDDVSQTFEYPVVIKPRRTAASAGLQCASSRDELLQKYDFGGEGDEVKDHSRPLIQEHVSGDIHDVCVLFDQGELRKVVTQKRVMTSRNFGGSGVINVTTNRPDLVEYAKQLLSPLDWDGVAQIEFVDGERDEGPKLIEINPKLWGTTELSIAAGVNFAKLLIEKEQGSEITDEFPAYQQDLYFIWYESGMLARFFQSKNKSTVLREIQRARRQTHRTNIDITDPLPHLARLPHLCMKGYEYMRDGVPGPDSCP